jgi:hypothetical protein
VEKSQYDLCLEVLGRLDAAGVLKEMVLVGSWCTLFYKDFFGRTGYLTTLKTRDMDLLIPRPKALAVKTDVAALLKDLGFIVGFTGRQGFIRLEHPQLIVEFLVPEIGRGSDKPYALPTLGVNAQSLRFLEFLAQDTITVTAGTAAITLPHPARFGLHKLLVMTRRTAPDKKAKDKDAGVRILNALIQNNQSQSIKTAFDAMPKRWQAKIKQQLSEITEKPILDMLMGTYTR